MKTRCHFLDPSLFYYHRDGKISGVLVTHINDFLHCADNVFEKQVIGKLCERFLVGSWQSEQFKYVGYQITQSGDGIRLSRDDYIDSAEVPDIPVGRKRWTEAKLSDEESTQYRSMVGTLNWVVQGTRPDLAFDMFDLSTRFQSCTVSGLHRVLKLMVKLKSKRSEVMFPCLGDPEGWQLVVYTDASFGNLSHGVDSYGGVIVFLVANGRCGAVVWRSGKIKRVVKSTMAAERLSLSEGLDEVVYVKQILCEILNLDPCVSLPIIGVSNHEGLCKSLRSTKLVDDRRLRIDLASMKQSLAQGTVKEVKLCATKDQLADVLTKKGVHGVLQTGVLTSEN